MSRATFRKHERLNDPRDFRRAFARRRSVSGSGLIVYAEWNGLAFSRLGVSVGKKKVKTAVGRNRVKRMVREAFRLTKSAVPVGLDLVVVPRGPDLDFATLLAGFAKLAQDAARRLPAPASLPTIP